jgi:phage-related protein
MNTWLNDAMSALPWACWVFVGLGLPLALTLLPRRDWPHRAMVLAVAFAAGSALQSAWMLVLGAVSQLYAGPIAGGLVIATLLAWATAAWKWRKSQAVPHVRIPFSSLECVVLLGIGVSCAAVWLATSYWVFSAYDTLWVYAYQARLYTLTNEIPTSIGYYPQYLQLQYAFYQIMGGQINDHIARTPITVLHVGAVLAAYTLGSRVTGSRRTGLLTAGIWALYPHVGEWAQMGDLEIPLAFSYTLASTFFLLAWYEPESQLRRHYAVLCGLCFGVAMWTKPTAGAFVWGVSLLVAAEFVRVRGSIARWWPRFETALITALACLPLGAVWYVRNIALGHPALDYPNASWLTLARRSGDLLSWPLLSLALYVAWSLLSQQRGRQQEVVLRVGGLLLAMVGALPSMPWLNPQRYDPPGSYLTPVECALIVVGASAAAFGLARWHRRTNTPPPPAALFAAGLLALPYFVTWFYSYSYHYRLAFAIVPLLILPSAWFIAHIGLPPLWTVRQRTLVAWASLGAICLGLVPLISFTAERQLDYLWNGQFPDDRSKYYKTNPSLMMLVDALATYERETATTPRVMAPGEQQLRFFFPLMTIVEKAQPTRLEELRPYTHYLYGSHAGWRYADYGISPAENQVVGSLARPEVMTRAAFHTDATFQYELYELNHDARFGEPVIDYVLPQEVIYGENAQLIGIETSTAQFYGTNVYNALLFRALKPFKEPYEIRFSLVDEATHEEVAAWQSAVAVNEHGAYHTTLWEPPETIRDVRILTIAPEARQAIPLGNRYRLRVALVNRAGDPLVVSIDGHIMPYYEYPGRFAYGG